MLDNADALETSSHEQGTGGQASMATSPASDFSPRRWSNVWQLPAIIISGAVIVMGVKSTATPAPPSDFDGALAQIEQWINSHKFEPAAARLQKVIEPNLSKATQLQRAKFHLLVGDLTLLSLEESLERADEAVFKRILNEYETAQKLAGELDPLHMERSAEVMLGLHDLEGARAWLAKLDALDSVDKSESFGTENAGNPQAHDSKSAESAKTVEPQSSARASRNRLFRRLVEYALDHAAIEAEQIVALLNEYRADRRASPTDEAWAVARLAELRLHAGQPAKAVEALLLDMRRLESRSGPEDQANLGELYTLLGRAYVELGDNDRATSHLEHALKLLEPFDPSRGEALLLLGQITAARGEFELALEQFHLVVRDFIGTRSHLSGLLAKAEMEAVLGEHESSLADYRQLAEHLLSARSGAKKPSTSVLTPERVAESLCDRHDAALTLGRLERALEYVRVAETLFPGDGVGTDVLYRLASTNRQIADNLIDEARGAAAASEFDEPTMIDPAIRHQANGYYLRAGEYYLRHAAAETAHPLSNADWATSLWLAADCADRGGRHDLAIGFFTRYLDTRPMEDQRRPQAIFRLAQCHHAQMEFDKAIGFYEKVISEHARSSFAAASHVPLARCYRAMNRAPEAQRQLLTVLSGDRLLQPDARDFRNALIELGRISYEQRNFAMAIERLAEAAARYPADRRRPETLFLLADSYRLSAAEIARTLADEPTLSSAEQGRRNAQRLMQLRTAQETFDSICEMYGSAGTAEAALTRLAPDLLRRAHLYRADCAFELGQFEQAVELYEHAARQFSAHSSSMYALVQIVNCYERLRDPERAAAAHRRALVRLRQLPDSAFDATDALMDRKAWERWLESNPVGSLRTAQQPEVSSEL